MFFNRAYGKQNTDDNDDDDDDDDDGDASVYNIVLPCKLNVNLFLNLIQMKIVDVCALGLSKNNN